MPLQIENVIFLIIVKKTNNVSLNDIVWNIIFDKHFLFKLQLGNVFKIFKSVWRLFSKICQQSDMCLSNQPVACDVWGAW